MSGRPRAGRRFLTTLGLVLVLATVPGGPTSRAQEAPELVGYDAVATGKAFTAFPSVPALLPVDAPAEGTMALATATLSSGGQGFGRASTFFPGTPIAGIRPLIEIASGQRLPIPDYPVVVESREFEPAKHNEQPGITMSSDVDPDRAVAVADTGGMTVPGAFGVRASRTVSSSLLKGTTLSATSTSTIEGIDLAGMVTIDSVVSTAAVTSDAVKAVCSGSVEVSGVTVAGRPARIDGEGIHLDDEAVVPGVGAGPLAEDALRASGITVRVLGGTDACSGANGTRSTGGLLISAPLPEAGSIPAGGRLDVVLASTAATVSASTLPPFTAPTFEPPPVIGDVLPRLPGPLAGGSTLDPVGPAASPPADASAPGGFLSTDEVAHYAFAGVPIPMALGLVLLAIPGARRLRAYMVRTLTLATGP